MKYSGIRGHLRGIDQSLGRQGLREGALHGFERWGVLPTQRSFFVTLLPFTIGEVEEGSRTWVLKGVRVFLYELLTVYPFLRALCKLVTVGKRWSTVFGWVSRVPMGTS